MRLKWVFPGLVFLALIVSISNPGLDAHAIARAQTETSPSNVQLLLETMTPEERVGQLFLVTFLGTDTGEQSQIYDLIVNHYIGGVVLRASNDNFVDAPNTVAEAYRLVAELQNIEWDSSLVPSVDLATGIEFQHAYIPLLIGIAQDGGGYPYDQILNGLTPLPNYMAIGSTWQPDLSRQVGTVLGGELSSIGINLYLGPSLDVLESPNPVGSGDPGTRVFGGDPFWVSEMGRAYISGLHAGSGGRLLVIAKHFPGQGGSDRPPEEEVPTIRKSLEQLKQIELAPFIAVTGNAPSTQETADGLLVSHIRYQGFQGNIRVTTRPVSFDAQALSKILDLPAFSSWHTNGGLMVSDDLGSQAVRRFYDPAGQSFAAHLVARDAFVAGNELLYLGNIVSSEAVDTYSTALRTLEFFAQKYREDPAFAQRVDTSVAHILAQKFRLYEQFSLSSVLPLADGLDSIGTSRQVSFEVARLCATLISPDIQELNAVLPEPPGLRDQLIIITDNGISKQCNTCLDQPTPAMDALQSAILHLYGPAAGGQVVSSHLSSYSFDDLSRMLRGGGGQRQLEEDLRQANWVVFLLSDASTNGPQLLRRFLSERQDLSRDKRLILFSLGAPYYLDATDISKLTAYYGLYSEAPPFIDVAARLLYQELSPPGASSVSIPAIGYDLISVTTPDPTQVIPLILDLPAVPTPTGQAVTPEPTPAPFFWAGDSIAVRTGIVLDHNGRPVPNGTVVRFSLLMGGEGGGILQQSETETIQGIARASFQLDKPGLLEIRASSEPALISEILQLDVSTESGAAVTVIVPVSTQTPNLNHSTIQTPVAGLGFSLTAEGYPRFGGWLVALIVLGIETYLAYWVGGRLHSRRWGLRWALCVLLSGLAAYNYLALGLPGSVTWVNAGGIFAVIGMTILGGVLGWVVAWLWMQRSNVPGSKLN